MSDINRIQAAENSIRIAIESMQFERLRLLPLASEYHRRHSDAPGFFSVESEDAARRCDELTTAINDLRALLEIAL